MDGLFIRQAADETGEEQDNLKLLTKLGNCEFMVQKINTLGTAWLEPGMDEDKFEFFYVRSGTLELLTDRDERSTLRAGDCFYIKNLSAPVRMLCLENAELLYVTDYPVFSDEAQWQNDLKMLLTRIDKKDHYTLHHSRAVMKYALALYEELKDKCVNVDMNTFIMGALFHDVGKCTVPQRILCKSERLSDEEYARIKHHAAESERILTPIFGKNVARIAASHHERLDGSGYPNKLKGDEIPFEARILSVADAFDAMTSNRIYASARHPIAAAEELYAMPDKYDRVVTEALVRLTRSGKIIPENAIRGDGSMYNDTPLDTLCAALCETMGIDAPSQSREANKKLIEFVKKAFHGKKADRLFMYNPDAIGQWIDDKYASYLQEVHNLTSLSLPLRTVMPSVTPVCFGTMYTGAQPDVHGIHRYEKRVITIDTLFDAAIRAGKKCAIVADTPSSMAHIYNGRDMDYYFYDTLAEINAKALQLIMEDSYDILVVYNGNYDEVMHKNGPESAAALAELRANDLQFAQFVSAIRSHWQKHRVLYGFAMDHGCHEIDGNCGSHGLDMEEDLNIRHYYGTLGE